MPVDPHTAPSDPTEAAASAWLARCDRGLTPAEQDDYLQWLREDPAHGQAIARLGRVWAGLDLLTEWRPEHSAAPNPDLLSGVRPQGSRWWRAGWALAIATAAALGFAWLARDRIDAGSGAAVAHAFATDIGLHHEVQLADGSTLELNTATALRAEFSSRERAIVLTRGEALFQVAKDPVRPFLVHAGAVSVRAVGTSFVVHRRPDAVEVLVTEGRVEVSAGEGWSGPQPLAAYQQMTIPLRGGAAAPPEVTAVSDRTLERLLAWRQGRLEFMDEPLREVAGAFGRYSRARIEVADPALAEFRIGGSFRADDPEAFVRGLEANFGIQVDRSTPGLYVLRRSAGP